jgi:hypothetical protein
VRLLGIVAQMGGGNPLLGFRNDGLEPAAITVVAPQRIAGIIRIRPKFREALAGTRAF